MRSIPLSLILFCLLGCTAVGQEITEETQGKLETLSSLMNKAGSLYVDGDYKKSASRVRSAQMLMGRLAEGASEQVLEAMAKDHARIVKAITLLESKGFEFKPFAALEEMATSVEEDDVDAISFSKQVAPILVQKCGRCHVRESRGEFSAESFHALKEGAPDGPVFTAGKPDKSSLVKLIETNAMPPRSTGFPEKELQVLKDWISQGAKFDGEDEEANITTLFESQNGDRRNSGRTSGRNR